MVRTAVPAALADVATPYAVIDEARLLANIEAMQRTVSLLGAQLRPHFKTHRTLEIARAQLAAGAVGFTCATVRQSVALRALPTCSQLVASPVQLDGAVHALICSSHHRSVSYSVDSFDAVTALRRALGPDRDADVMVEVENRCGRTGASPDDCAEIARFARKQGFRVVGVFSYPGEAYRPGAAAAASEQERKLLDQAAGLLCAAGHDVQHISAGSTPTMRHAAPGIITEYRPGTYVLGDRQQVQLGSMQASQVALTIAATVIVARHDRIVVNAGGKSIGRDSPLWLPYHGCLENEPDLTVAALYDYHAVIPITGPTPHRVGDTVRLVPNNANSALAPQREVWLTRDRRTASSLQLYAG